MNITVNPYKLSLSEMEVRLDGKSPLLPGQLLRFEGVSPVYGEVIGVRTLDPDKDEGSLVKIRVLYGVPNLAMQTVTVLTDDQMTAEVQRLQEPFEYPLRLGAFTTEFDNLGALTLIEGDEFALKYEALNTFIRAIRQYQRLVVIDPLGVYTAGDHAYYRAGDDIRLSLQSVGSKRFLTAMAETFPDSLKNQALQALAGYLPVTADFVAFAEIVRAASYDHSPLRNLLLQSLHAAVQSRVFADDPQHEFDFQRLITDALTVIDLSSMDEPWKTLFYEEICLEIFRNAGGDVVPVLIYPENYLADFGTWVHKADEAELNLLVLTSPYPPESLEAMANNMVLADSAQAVRMEGELTLGLPVSFALPPAGAEASPLESESAWTEVPAEVPPPQPPEAPPIDMAAAQAVVSETVVLASPAPEPEPLYEPEPVPQLPEPPVPAPPAPEASPLPDAGAFDSILGNLETVVSEPEDFDFDLNLDQHEPDAAAAAGLPESLHGFEEPIPSPLPEAAPMPTLAEEAWGPSISDIEAGLTQPPEPLPEPFPPMPPMPPPEPHPVAGFPPEAPAAPMTAGLYEAPESPPFPPAYPDMLAEPPTASPSEVELAAFEAQLAPPMPEPVPLAPPDLGPPPPPMPAGIVDITAPSLEPPPSPMPGPLAPPPLEHTVTEPDPYEMMPVYSTPAQPEAGYRGFNVGDRVVHPTYGAGVISKVIPMENNVILNITFDQVGKRLLDPSLCQLERE